MPNEFAALHGDAAQPLQDFRRNVERGPFANLAELRTELPCVDKAGARYVFNIGGERADCRQSLFVARHDVSGCRR